MSRGARILKRIPILKTLEVCTKTSREHARIELIWHIGFAFLQVFLVSFIVIFTKSVLDAPREVWTVVNKGELMIYAASVCGAVLYSLRHNFSGPLPDSLKQSATSLGTLSTVTGLFMTISVLLYVIKSMAEINHLPLNQALLNVASIIVLALSVSTAYVVFALKHALASGATQTSHEQTEEFGKRWENFRDA